MLLTDSKRQPRSEWWPEAERLAATGLTQAEIARRLGVSSSAVSKALRPEARAKYNQRTLATRDVERHREVDKAWRRKEQARGRCQECNALMGAAYLYRKARTEKSFLCKACWSRRRSERCHEIERLWAAGESLKAIAARLGWTMGHLGQEFHRMRQDGYDLPYRYAVKNGRRAEA